MLVLTLAVAVLSFAHSFASWALNLLSALFLVCGLFELFIQGNTGGGVRGLVITFIVFPCGLPAVAEWLIPKLDDLNYFLKSVITV